MSERERYNPETGNYETDYDPGIYGNAPVVRPDDRTPSGGGSTPDYNNQEHPNYNGGSPPDQPLKPGYGWEWTGSDWVQVQGRGLGYKPVSATKTTAPQTTPQTTPAANGGTPLSGVPTAWGNRSSQLSGSVPTLADAIRDSKQLPQAPSVSPYAAFTPPQPVGLDGRNQIINAILARPQVMDQQFQDQLFEQQKETQSALAQQALGRAAQMGAGRGLSAQGGFSAAALGGVEENFMNTLLAGKRDIATQAAQANRQSELAAIQMQDAIAQGDFSRAQAAYDTQLKASALYDELRFKAAEFDRANVALAAQTGMAGRQQQMAEQVSSFQQYIEQLRFEEMMRQFNEQIGLDYGKFGWNQQLDLLDRS